METVSFDSFSLCSPQLVTGLRSDPAPAHSDSKHHIREKTKFRVFKKYSSWRWFNLTWTYLMRSELWIMPYAFSSQLPCTLGTTDAQWSNTSWSKLKFYHLQSNLFPEGSGNHMPAECVLYNAPERERKASSWREGDSSHFLIFLATSLSSSHLTDKTI